MPVQVVSQINYMSKSDTKDLDTYKAADESEETKIEGQVDSDNDDYNEDEDEDYDPSKKQADEQEQSEESDNEPEPDYSNINTGVSQVRTRTQRYQDSGSTKRDRASLGGLVKAETSGLNVDALFESLQNDNVNDEWRKYIKEDTPKKDEPKMTVSEAAAEMIRIETTYTFAGKLVRESKMVDANSAEAKAYLNSTSGIMRDSGEKTSNKSYVTVIRKVPGSDEQVPLRIKLKRPSLIDKFLAGDKKNKLTTLEKSRLDWASFVDKKSIKDDLSLHNKAGYLEKQDFLGRMDAKRDLEYQKAKELDRQRQWQLQQKNT